MKTIRTFFSNPAFLGLSILGALFCFTSRSLAQETATPEQISGWIQDLESKSFADRSQAAKNLAEFRCYQAVLQEMVNDEARPESRNACMQIFKNWAGKFDPKRFDELARIVAKVDPEKAKPSNDHAGKLRRLYAQVSRQGAFDHLENKGADVARASGGQGFHMILHHSRWRGEPQDLKAVHYLGGPVDFQFVDSFQTRWLKAIVGEQIDSIYLGVRGKSKIENEDVRLLGRCTKLRHLDLRYREAAPELFPTLATLKHLNVLHLPMNVTDQQLESIAKLEQLTLIDLGAGSTSLKGPGLKCLPEIPNLQILRLGRISVDPEHLEVLSKIPRLRDLTLHAAKQPDQAIAQVVKAKNIQVLDVSKSAITNQGMAQLVNLNKLKHLTFGDANSLNITNAGIKKLLDLPDLQSVRNRGALISDPLVIKFQEQKIRFYSDRRFRYGTELDQRQLKALRRLFLAEIECARSRKGSELKLVVRKKLTPASIELLNQFGKDQMPSLEFDLVPDDRQAQLALKLNPHFSIRISDNRRLSEAMIEKLVERFGPKCFLISND